MLIRVVAVALLLASCVAYTEEEKVLVLTDDDFPGVFEEFSLILIEFYAPWCGHCKKLAPVYVEVAKELDKKQSKVKLAKINCDEHEKAKNEYGVKGFPTLIFFANGVNVSYTGGRTKEPMVSWLLKREEPAMIEIPNSKVQELRDDKDVKVSVVFYGDIESQAGRIMTDIALGDDYNVYYHVVDSKETNGSVEIIRSFGGPLTISEVDENTKKWINLYDRPLLVQFDDRTISSIFSERKDALIFFNAEDDKSLVEEFKAAAEEWIFKLSNTLIFSEIPSDHEHHLGLSSYIKILPKKVPFVYIKGEERKKLVMVTQDGVKFTRTDIIDFLKGIKNEKIYELDEAVDGVDVPNDQEL